MSDRGLTIDLSGLREVTVDPERKLVRAGGGCLLGTVDAATAPHGLIVPAGIMSETGAGGLALGGGIGWFSRKHGLTCDQFVSLELVLASGEVIEVSAEHLIDVEFEDGHRYCTKEAHAADLADEAIDRLVDFWKDMPMEGEVEIIGLGGAIGDVSEDATAFSNRGYLLWLNFAMRWDDPARDGEFIQMTRDAVTGLKPWTGQGVCVNMLPATPSATPAPSAS